MKKFGFLKLSRAPYLTTVKLGQKRHTQIELGSYATQKNRSFAPPTLKCHDKKGEVNHPLPKSEKAWLNKYHYEVLQKVGPLLEGDVKSWFELKCRPMN